MIACVSRQPRLQQTLAFQACEKGSSLDEPPKPRRSKFHDTGNSGGHGLLRGLVKDAAVYGLGIVATRLVGFFMIPIYTRVLTPADYGVLDAITRLTDVLSLLLALGLAQSVMRYYNEPEDDAGRRRLASTALLMVLGMVAVGFLLFLPASALLTHLLFGDWQHVALVRVAVGAMLFRYVVALPLTLFQAARRAWRFTILSLFQFVTMVLLNILFVVIMRLGVLGALLSGLVSNLAWGVGLTINLVLAVGVSFDRRYARRLFSYGLPLVPAALAGFVLHSSDRFFLVRLAPIEELGLYSLAYRFALLVSTFAGFVGNAWWPWAFCVEKGPDSSRLLRDGSALVLTAAAGVCAGVILFSGPVIRVLAAEPFWAAQEFVPILAISYWFFAAGAPFSLGCRLAERTDSIAAANIIAAIITLVLSFLLIPPLGAWGAVWVTIAGFAIRAAALAYASHSVMKREQLWGAVAWSLVALVAAAGWVRWVGNFAMPLELAFRSVLWVAIVFGLTAYYLSATRRVPSVKEWLIQVARSATGYLRA